MTNKQFDEVDLSRVFQVQLSILGSLLIFVGLVGADAYYAYFGVHYESIGLSTMHLMYRGITAAFDGWYLWAIYFFAALISGAPSFLKLSIRRQRPMLTNVMMLMLAFILVAVAYLGTQKSAKHTAIKNMTKDISTLPHVINIRLDQKNLEYVGMRLLALGTEYVVLIDVVEDPITQQPHTFLVRREEAHEIVTHR